MRTHGVRATYANTGCRCDLCSVAERDFQRRMRRRLIAANDPRHGSHGTYVGYACRCDACRAGHASYIRTRRAAQK